MMKILLIGLWFVAWFGAAYFVDSRIDFFVENQAIVMLIGAILGLINAAIWRI